jgi:mRNA interferase MazF
MGAFAAGNIVLLAFPFSDLTGSKQRPALLLASVGRGDCVACQITSNPYGDPSAITLGVDAFDEGGLQRLGFVRPGRLFTANQALMQGPVGVLTESMLTRARRAVVTLIVGEKSPTG